MFLSWYSPEALAAAMPTGILSFALVSFFLGTSMYVSTFVAQYSGAGRDERVGPAIWQGIYFSVIGGGLVGATFLLAVPIFKVIGHDPAIQALEVEYWKYMTIGAVFPIVLGAVSGFFNGRGKTYPVMWASFAATGVNIVLNYILIFGNLGFPEMGIGGAGLSTVVSQFVNLVILVAMSVSDRNNIRFGIVSGWKFDRELFLRLIKFGMPNGVQFFLDIAAFSAFILIIGRLGAPELAATNIAMNVSMLTFMPMIGLGITVSILVGQSLGADRPEMADRATYSALQMSFLYTLTCAALYLIVPWMFIYPFAAKADPTEFEIIKQHAMVAMRFVAAWSVFDSLAIVISSALKGAGDTRFIMIAIVFLSLGILTIPTYIIIDVLEMGLRPAWTVAVAYTFALGITFLLRFRTGKWRTMRVIEQEPVKDVLRS